MIPTLSSPVAPEVVIMTTSSATNDDKVGIISEVVVMTTSGATSDDKVGIISEVVVMTTSGATSDDKVDIKSDVVVIKTSGATIDEKVGIMTILSHESSYPLSSLLFGVCHDIKLPLSWLYYQLTDPNVFAVQVFMMRSLL